MPARHSSAQILTPLCFSLRQSSAAKGKAATTKSKAMAAPGPSRVEGEDVESMDVKYKYEAPSSESRRSDGPCMMIVMEV